MSRNGMGDFSIKNAGHCTRCGDPFGGNATAYMVREKVAWSFRGDDGNDNPTFAMTQRETVAVCDACVTATELANATEDATCKGCGQRMKLNPYWRKSTCSNRCEQRERRARRRAHRRQYCATCKMAFTGKRADARFCSNACRQEHYRMRQRPELRAAAE
jgi:hypothetical protein